jgi:SAM-dependent methyltransferase
MGRGTRPVLELACGTGRLTIPIARDGHETVGLDTSPTMLEAARAKAESSGLGNTFVRGDMRAFALHRHFGLIVVSCNSLAHLTTNEDLRACLRRVRDHLEPGGFFAFDIVNPDVTALARPRSKSVRLDLGPKPSSAIAVEEVAFRRRISKGELCAQRRRAAPVQPKPARDAGSDGALRSKSASSRRRLRSGACTPYRTGASSTMDAPHLGNAGHALGSRWRSKRTPRKTG